MKVCSGLERLSGANRITAVAVAPPSHVKAELLGQFAVDIQMGGNPQRVARETGQAFNVKWLFGVDRANAGNIVRSKYKDIPGVV